MAAADDADDRYDRLPPGRDDVGRRRRSHRPAPRSHLELHGRIYLRAVPNDCADIRGARSAALSADVLLCRHDADRLRAVDGDYRRLVQSLADR